MHKSKIILFSFVSLLFLNSPSLLAKDFKDSKYSHVEYPGWFIDSPFLELSDDLATARTAGKQGLMVVYSTEGCSYCGLFIEKSLGNPEIAAMVQKHFGSLGLEIFDDTNLVGPQGQETTVKAFAKQEGVMFSPSVLFYDKEGKRVLRITGYQAPERFKTSLQYVIGKHYQTQSIAEYTQSVSRSPATAVSAAPLRQDPLFNKPPHFLQRNVFPAHEPLLVIFETRGCDECEVFHNKVLGNKQVRDSLENYEVVRLDSQDNRTIVITPDGKRITPASWYKQEGFSRTPALLFFNESGLAAIKTDALVLQQRMMNSINYVIERAYTKGWSYQRFARSKAIERNLRKTAAKANN